MNIALIGFGNVGQGLVSILVEKAEMLTSQYAFSPRVVAVATGSRGALYDPEGLDLPKLLELAGQGGMYLENYPQTPTLQRNWDTMKIVQESNADVLVEASPTNLQTGQPALDLCLSALQSGKHVVLANKGPIAVAYAELTAQANAAGKLVRIEGTVMAGTPSIRLATQALAGCNIIAAKGILNGTTNYILTQMENGMEYADALLTAQELGYAETDPNGDVEGWDAAGKVIILGAALFGLSLTFGDLDVKGITQITAADIKEAADNGERWKLIAEITPQGGRVQPLRLPLSHPLAGVSGATNAITYTTDLMGDITLIGAGAGRCETGFALLSDLLDVHRMGL